MSGEPRRLRDDPAFRVGLNCDLDDEGRALDAPDLAQLKARVLAAVALDPGGGTVAPGPEGNRPGVPQRRLRRLFATTATLGLFLLALLAGWPVAEPEPIPPSAEATPPVEARPPAPAERAPRDTTPPASTVTMASTPAPSVIVDAASADVVPIAGSSAALPPPNTPSEDVPSRDKASSDLAEQVAALESAEAVLARGDAVAAVAAFEAIPVRWPAGVFLAEARLGALRAHAARGDWVRVESLAGELANDPELAARREDVLALRAEALAALGRCAEAKEVARPLGSAIRARVRAACR